MSTLEFLTVKELSNTIKARPKTIYKWARTGKIPSYKVNGLILFDADEIHAFVKSRKVKPLTNDIIAKKKLGLKLKPVHNRRDSGQKAFRTRR